jgi:radical SAM protein with 4Fe4S-binding SPASM domain
MIGLTKLITQRESPSDRIRYGDVDGKTKTHKFEDNGVYRPVIVFNIESACNLACQHCYYSARYQPLPDELSTQEIFGVIDDLSKLQVPLVLVSGGEPLMKKDIFTILEYFNFKGIETAISTNGTLIKPSRGEIEKAKKVFKMLKSQKGDGTGKRIAVIAHNGNVHLSQFWLTEKIGNVREEKFSRIWNDNSNPILKYLREKVREELEGKCGVCPVKDLCGGFRPRAYAYTVKINSSDPLCYINQDDMKTITEFIRREIGEGEEEKGIEEEKLLQEKRAN